MQLTRRDLGRLAFAGAMALGASGLLLAHSSLAETGDEAAVNQAVEALRKAMLEADKTKLQELTADQLSYGHSAGKVETKAEFINVIADKKTVYKSITYSDPSTKIAGNDAIVRHAEAVDFESDGKPGSAKIGVLQIWQKQGGSWKLLARQAFRT
jgi:Domain of unknown function (DUF4440)